MRNRFIGREIKKMRKRRGLRTRDSSIGYFDLRNEWAEKIASRLSEELNRPSVGRETFPDEEIEEEEVLELNFERPASSLNIERPVVVKK